MKKYIAFLLALILLLSFNACSISLSNSESDPSNSSSINEDNTSTDDQDDSLSSDIWDDIWKEEFPSFKETASIEEVVLYSEKDLVITATELSYETSRIALDLTIENNSKKSYTFTIDSCAINGIVFPAYLYCSVEPDKKDKDTVYFNFSELQLYGINEVADLLLCFDIYDKDYKHLYSDPIQLKTSSADSFIYDKTSYQTAITSEAAQNNYAYSVVKFSNDIVYNKKGVRVLSQSLLQNESEELLLLLEVENTSPEKVYFCTGNISINDLLIYGRFTWSSDAILSGTRAIVDISLSSLVDADYFSAYGIDEISTLCVEAVLRNADGKEIAEATAIPFAINNSTPSFDVNGTPLYENDNLRILLKDVVHGTEYHEDDIYILLLAENKRSSTVSLDDKYNSFSLNGFMTDCICYSADIPTNKYAIVAIELSSYSLEDTDVSSIEDIEDFEISFEVRNSKYKLLDKVTVSHQTTN